MEHNVYIFKHLHTQFQVKYCNEWPLKCTMRNINLFIDQCDSILPECVLRSNKIKVFLLIHFGAMDARSLKTQVPENKARQVKGRSSGLKVLPKPVHSFSGADWSFEHSTLAGDNVQGWLGMDTSLLHQLVQDYVVHYTGCGGYHTPLKQNLSQMDSQVEMSSVGSVVM